MSRRGLPQSISMRHDSHYVEALAASAGTPVGRMVPIDQIDPNPNQPRQVMGDLSELIASISEKGIIEPIVVRQRGERFQIVAGERRYPHIVIDCPPTLGLLTVNALVAATHLLIPIQSSYFALEGTDDLLETIEKVRARPNPALRILGVVITMHDKRTALARDIRTQIQKVFGGKVFKTVITKSVRLEESPAYKESIFTFAPDSTGATEYYSLCEEVIDRA